VNTAGRFVSLSFDLDDKWSYLKTRGDPSWRSFPSYMHVVVPRALGLLKSWGLTITFFIVGQDAALPRNAGHLRAIAEAGHEIGNHSFHHEPWLHLYSEAQLREEIGSAEEAILAATGVQPMGFRGPGYSVSPSVSKVLCDLGYSYDASLLPTFVGPFARAYYFLSARLNETQKHERKILFGTLRDGFQPLRPYRVLSGERSLVEIPVTTMPVFRIPVHFSYLLYLCRYSEALARTYFSTSVCLWRLFNLQPSLLFHPLDLLGAEDAPELSFFPAMDLPADRKIAFLGRIVEDLTREYPARTLHEHAQIVEKLRGRRTKSVGYTERPHG